MIPSGDIAALVRAFLFQLIRASSGQVVAELADAIDVGGIPPLDLVGLRMLHLEDAATWPDAGHLAWSAPNPSDGYPIVALAGAGDSYGNAPTIELRNSGAIGTPATDALITCLAWNGADTRGAEIVASATAGGTSSISLTATDSTVANEYASLTVQADGLRVGNLSRDAAAFVTTGYAFDGLWGADITCTTAGANLNASMTFANCIAGDVILLDACFSFRATAYSAGVVPIGRIYVNGTNIGPECYHNPTATGQGATVPLCLYYTVPTNGSYTFALYGFKSAAGGTYVASYHTTLRAQRLSRK